MIIKDEGYVLSAKKYGEKALIVTLLTKSKGKIAGFVSEGAGKKNRGLFQPGNKLFFEASARLEENMRRLFRLESRCTDLYNLCRAAPRPAGEEWTRSPERV